jgi:hypothetical protein
MSWSLQFRSRKSFVSAIAGLLLAISIPAVAKDAPVTAIVLFDGPGGPTYIQVTGLTMNNKTEVRVCDGVPKFDKRGYDTLARMQFAGATSLERTSTGVLSLTADSKSYCVVPSNLRFDAAAVLSPSDAAEQAFLQGTLVGSDPAAGLPAFKPGVKLVFVAAPDAELAEYLTAQRANTAKSWQDFLLRHAGSSRASDARNALAAIYEQSAESAFAKYQSSAAARNPQIALLKEAQQHALDANKTIAGYAPANKLRMKINQELDALLEPDRSKLQIYRKAEAEHTAGYQQLIEARQHNDQVLQVNPEYAPALNLHNEIAQEEQKLLAALDSADPLITAQRYDEALAALGPYQSFAGESPRIDSIMAAAYEYHFSRGQQFGSKQDWEPAAAEFRKAGEIRAGNKEAVAALKNAELRLADTRNRQAADRAVQQSSDYAAQKQFIEAYEVLAELPDAQRSLVADRMAALQKDYVPAAARRAQKLQELHVPIRGRADEDAMREAYDLLNHAAAMTGDPATKLKLDLLSDKISAYYVDVAKRYLAKPLGSGVGLGWLYLGQAEHFKPGLDDVKDQMAQYAPAYQLRARLSIGVVLRDQTSRRDSPGFADQLADAIATGLDSSGLPVKVVRQPKEGADVIQPNFLLVGEILQHRVVKEVNLETLQSKYRAGTHEVKNEAWAQANSAYEAAQQQLAAAQRALADAQAQHNKKQIAAATDAVTAAQQQADAARHKLDGTEQSIVQSVVAPYNYTRKNLDLNAVVELAFRIADQAGNVVEPSVPVRKDNHKTFTVLENVKPEDTEGVKEQGSEPDETQFLTDLEIQARDALVQSVREKAKLLPVRILQAARSRVQQNDLDGAAEQYIVYLNATPDAATPERDEAARFLRERFNVSMAKSSP